MPRWFNYSTGEVVCQEDIELEDGRRNWKGRKKMSLKVAELMKEYDKVRAKKIRLCSTYLEFVQTPDGERKLHKANFCRERLCPTCQWRRSIKLGRQADKIYKLLTDKGYKHIFITLTVRNCRGGDLSATIDHLGESLARLKRSELWKRAIAGSYRALEVTYNKETDTYHPHFHILATVEGGYFDKDNGSYITKDKLIAAWKAAARLDYDPSVDIEGITQKEGQSITSACAEICKYPLKSAEIESSAVLEIIDRALRGRRLIQWSGVAQDARRELDLDDIESGNLIQVDGELPGEEELQKIVYIWRYGVYTPVDYRMLKEQNR